MCKSVTNSDATTSLSSDDPSPLTHSVVKVDDKERLQISSAGDILLVAGNVTVNGVNIRDILQRMLSIV